VLEKATVHLDRLIQYIKQQGVEPDRNKITAQLPSPGFHVLPRRWIMERTFSLLGRNRRLSKDYEQRCESEEARIYIAMTRLMARHLAAACPFSDSSLLTCDGQFL